MGNRTPGNDGACDEIVLFSPARGPGYEDIPFDDETPTNQYASYLRRDLMMLVQYAPGTPSTSPTCT